MNRSAPAIELKNYFSDALIPAVRITRQIMATLLAAQIFFAFGLCGFVCCVSAQTAGPVQTVAADSRTNHDQTAVQPAEVSSHCHAKAEKKAPVKPQPQVEVTKHCHDDKPGGQSFAATSARICQCDAESQPNPDVSLTQSDSLLQKCAFASLPVWQAAEQSPPQPSASPPELFSLSPPFSGYQLSLRI